MKKIFSIGVVVLISLPAYAEDTQPKTQLPSFNITIQNTPVNSSTITQETVVSQNLMNQTSNYLHQLFSPEHYGHVKNGALNFSEFCLTYVKEHKMRVILASLATLYVVVECILVRLTHKLSNPTSWGLWKQTVSFENLLSMSQKEVSKDLIFSIQQRYQTESTLTDFLTPFITFLRDIDQEIHTVKRLIRMQRILTTLRIARFFPYQYTLPTLSERLQKLLFLKELFISWIAQYKINTNVPAEY